MAVNRAAKFLGSNEIRDIFFWQTLGALLASILEPALAGLRAEAFKLDPSLPLSPAEVANAVIRHHMERGAGTAEARLSGIDTTRFGIMLDAAGNPLPLDALTEAWRRGFIPQSGEGADSVSLEQGIRESDLKDKWIKVVEQLQFHLAPVGVIIEAWLRAQIDPAAAIEELRKNGVDEATGTLMFKAAGRPPGPAELFELFNRGIIPEGPVGGDALSLEQGFKETDLKDKWYEKWKQLAVYHPPPRTVTALLRAGTISEDTARDLFHKSGLSHELADAYVRNARHERQSSTRELTKAEIVALYESQAITREDLIKRLEQHRYSASDAELEAELADLKVNRSLLNHAIQRVGSLYVGRRIPKTQAMVSLDALKIPAGQRDRLLQVWSLERQDNLKHLTPAEIGTAVKDGIFSEDEGIEELGKQGYGPRDAWISLALHLKKSLAAAMPSDNIPPP